jgi:hypothetical protein
VAMVGAVLLGKREAGERNFWSYSIQYQKAAGNPAAFFVSVDKLIFYAN